MKKALWVIIISGWWHSATAQSHGGMEQYYSLQDKHTFIVVPVVHFDTKNNWYAEARYNYEAPETASVYGGKTFSHEAAVSVSFSPLAGIVAGGFNGGSAGFNAEADYKKFSLSSQAQYTFSVTDKYENFTYSWTDLGYQALPFMSAGFSLQQTRLYRASGSAEAGVFISAEFKNWSVPFYFFNPGSRQNYFIIGLSCEWQSKNDVKTVGAKIK